MFGVAIVTAFFSCGAPPPDVAPELMPQPETGDTTSTQAVGTNMVDTLFGVDTLQASNAAIPLISAEVHLAKGLSFSWKIPTGYELLVASEGMERLRFITPSPDGRLFLTDMHDLTDNRKGRVYVVDGWDEGTGRFAVRHTYLTGLHNPNQVAFHEVGGKQYIYVATTDELLRYPYVEGDTAPSTKPTVINTFPDYGLGYKYGGWHLTRSLAFHHDKLYVSVGSSCNACIEKEDVRACILEMDPDGANARIYASGLRNAVGMQWIGDELYVTNMGSDQFGTDEPQDQLQRVVEGRNYGWPFYHQFADRVVQDTVFPASDLFAPPNAYATLGAHVAPLGLDFLQGFGDSLLNNRFLIALHGSSIVKMAKGYAIVSVKRGSPIRTVVTGFLQGKARYGRPCGLLQCDTGSFWFTDDLNGVLYLLRRKK